jgi:hypothetical protein
MDSGRRSRVLGYRRDRVRLFSNAVTYGLFDLEGRSS